MEWGKLIQKTLQRCVMMKSKIKFWKLMIWWMIKMQSRHAFLEKGWGLLKDGDWNTQTQNCQMLDHSTTEYMLWIWENYQEETNITWYIRQPITFNAFQSQILSSQPFPHPPVQVTDYDMQVSHIHSTAEFTVHIVSAIMNITLLFKYTNLWLGELAALIL